MITLPHYVIVNSFIAEPFSLKFDTFHVDTSIRISERDDYDDFVSGYININMTNDNENDTEYRYNVSYSVAHGKSKGESGHEHLIGDRELTDYVLSILYKHHAQIDNIY